MIIGKFQQENGVYVGSIPALAAAVRVAPTDQKGVDYAVTIPGSEVELGVGWNRTSAKGKPYVSVKIDAPTLAAPINGALVKQQDGFALLWDRPRAGEAAETEAAA
jgi:uncharacterized protein (DUF736 family)